jgi:hypothetical protein
MGWKSTRTITRQRALELIMSRLLNATDREVADSLESLGFGENTDLPYYGHNFMIGDEDDAKEDDDRYIT